MRYLLAIDCDVISLVRVHSRHSSSYSSKLSVIVYHVEALMKSYPHADLLIKNMILVFYLYQMSWDVNSSCNYSPEVNGVSLLVDIWEDPGDFIPIDFSFVLPLRFPRHLIYEYKSSLCWGLKLIKASEVTCKISPEKIYTPSNKVTVRLIYSKCIYSSQNLPFVLFISWNTSYKGKD